MMKKLLLLTLFALAFAQCKKDPEPVAEISGIVGNWHMVETRYPSGDSTVIKNMANEQQKAFSIRFDGVMLYDGYAYCCAASEYVVNGKPFEVTPKKEIPRNLDCGLVDCWACPKLTITQSGDEMTIESCNGVHQQVCEEKIAFPGLPGEDGRGRLAKRITSRVIRPSSQRA